MKRIWLAAALAPLSFAAAQADTTISGSKTTAVATSTSGAITIQSGGSVEPSAGPAAVTVDSSDSVSNAGTIHYGGVDDATGLLVDTSAGDITSTITNSGTISVSETTSGDGTNQSITSGPFANGYDRYGILVSGAGTLDGSITNTGTITIIGEDSAAIEIDSAMTGDLVQTGTITVTGGTPTYATSGDNSSDVTNAGNVTYGVRSTALIEGNVNIGGTVSAVGQNATAVSLSGGIGGSLEIDGTITATGYRSTTAPTDPKVLAKLHPDQTLQGGPALDIGGDVGGGITIEAYSAASGNTSAVTEGVVTTYGSAPALLIGGSDAIAIGANTDGYSLEIGGAVEGLGEYPDVSATAIQIGGTNPLAVDSSGVASGSAFGDVTLDSGIDISGTVEAISESHTAGEGDSTAILIGAGASVSSLTNSGTIMADTASDALVGNSTGTAETSVTGKSVPITVAAIKVESGGSLTSLTNDGIILAEITGISTATNYTAAGGVEGQAIAIYDASGSLTSVTNTYSITALIDPIVYGQSVQTDNADAIAMYLANTDGNVTVTQSANGNTSITPSITGDIIFGRSDGTTTGSEALDLEAGTITGDVAYYGLGDNSLTIGGNATLTGALSQAGGGSLAIDIEDGLLDMTAPTAETLGGDAASISVSSLHIGSSGQIIFTVDPTAASASAQFEVSGAATLDDGAKVGVAFTSKLTETETFDLIHAASLTAAGLDTSLVGTLPYLYKGEVTTTATDLDLTVSIKTAAELRMNRAQAAAYDAIYSQMSTDSAVESDVLSQTTRAGLFHIYNQFLPDYAGGAFDTVVTGQRALARAEADAPVKMETDDTRGWVQEISATSSRDGTAVANGYQTRDLGVVAGVERAHGDSAVGVAGAIIGGNVDNDTQSTDASLSVLMVEGGVYWRKSGDGLNANASLNAGYVSLGSHRLLLEQTSSGSVGLLRNAESTWSGAVASGRVGVGYQLEAGRFYMRPEVTADYIAFYESAHSEHGGGEALNMGIGSRMSAEASVQADTVFGWTFGQAIRWRPELTLGWRQIVSGGADDTVARFLSGGDTFTLTPDNSDRGGVLARLGVRAGGGYADFSADAGGEFRQGYQTYDARAVARFLF